MARYYDEEGYEDYPHYPRRPRRPILETIAYLLIFGIIGLTAFLAWPALRVRIGEQISGQLPLPTAQIGNVGGMAPPSVVRRSPPDPVAPAAPQDAAPAVQDGIAAYNATAQAQYTQAIAPIAAPTPPPLPLNGAGQPVIDQAQQAQEQQSLQLAEQEGAAAADQALAAQRASADADAASRAPDVSKADAEAEMHRPLCSVPRANPATCDRGLFKPTPVQ